MSPHYAELMPVLETAFVLKRLPECASRHIGTLDTCRLPSTWLRSELGAGFVLPVTE